jgi:protein-L-isoaspartate(D-aspartate) O-methyltransferase
MYKTAVGLLLVITVLNASAKDNYEEKRQKMMAAIQHTVDQTSGYTGKATLDERVMAVMGSVPRHKFVPEKVRQLAYENSPLLIGSGQTISQPYIVALMTDLAEVDQNSIVLEVGTGSGYQAAILAELTKHVYTIEIVEELGLDAKQRLQRLGYENVTVKIGDGYHGWEEHAPFDAILVTAAPEKIPEPLIRQLKPGGRLVIPVGKQFTTQSLIVLKAGLNGEVEKRNVLPVGFVPLTGDH